LGQIDADGKTTAEIEKTIAARLQVKAGLASRPDASVQIVRFRPFYVVGGVEKPGEYDFRPGLTVLQAVGIAGGPQRVAGDALIGFEKDALNSRGDLRVLSADRTSLLARQARLDAEIGQQQQIAFPNELQNARTDAVAARAMREETLLFESRRSGLAGQVSALEQNKAFLHNEINELQQKTSTIENQLAAMRKEYQLIAGLVSKGLSGAPRQLELEQNIAQIQNNELDVQVAIVRANEDISKSDRDILDLTSKARNDALQEAADVRVKLIETEEKIQTSQALIDHAEEHAPGMMQALSDAYAAPTYIVSRRHGDGKVESIVAKESDLVLPGDAVRVVPHPVGGASLSEVGSVALGQAN
jgi:protein involved in polysaccharide export with SLBB domain